MCHIMGVTISILYKVHIVMEIDVGVDARIFTLINIIVIIPINVIAYNKIGNPTSYFTCPN